MMISFVFEITFPFISFQFSFAQKNLWHWNQYNASEKLTQCLNNFTIVSIFDEKHECSLFWRMKKEVNQTEWLFSLFSYEKLPKTTQNKLRKSIKKSTDAKSLLTMHSHSLFLCYFHCMSTEKKQWHVVVVFCLFSSLFGFCIFGRHSTFWCWHFQRPNDKRGQDLDRIYFYARFCVLLLFLLFSFIFSFYSSDSFTGPKFNILLTDYEFFLSLFFSCCSLSNVASQMDANIIFMISKSGGDLHCSLLRICDGSFESFII